MTDLATMSNEGLAIGLCSMAGRLDVVGVPDAVAGGEDFTLNELLRFTAVRLLAPAPRPWWKIW